MKPYYQDELVTIYHGEALEVMPNLRAELFDILLTDPPYTQAGGSSNGRTSQADGQFFDFWLKAILGETRRVMRANGCGFVFCDWRTVGSVARCMNPFGERQTESAWTVSQAIVWDREHIGLGSPFRNAFEMIAFARGPVWLSPMPKNIPNVIRHFWPYGRHQYHPAEKPVELCRTLAKWMAFPASFVFDPFLGSGSSAVAAKLLGLHLVGIEIEERYCEIAANRCRQTVMQFDPPSPQLAQLTLESAKP